MNLKGDAPHSSPEVSSKGETVGAWIPAKLVPIFRGHVGYAQGAAGKFAVAAIREKLEREGAFKDEPAARALKLIKNVKPAELPLLAQFLELLEARGAEATAATLEELATESAKAEGTS